VQELERQFREISDVSKVFQVPRGRAPYSLRPCNAHEPAQPTPAQPERPRLCLQIRSQITQQKLVVEERRAALDVLPTLPLRAPHRATPLNASPARAARSRSGAGLRAQSLLKRLSSGVEESANFQLQRAAVSNPPSLSPSRPPFSLPSRLLPLAPAWSCPRPPQRPHAARRRRGVGAGGSVGLSTQGEGR